MGVIGRERNRTGALILDSGSNLSLSTAHSDYPPIKIKQQAFVFSNIDEQAYEDDKDKY